MSETQTPNSSLVQIGSAGLVKVHNALRVTESLLNSYDSVVIGDQEWMKRNLNVSRFRNGDQIPEIQDDDEWEKAGKEGNPAWCYYENNPEKGAVCGKLYNWHAVNDARGLAPDGWHVPNNSDWNILIAFLGGQEVAGKKMKAVSETPELISTDAKSNTETDYLWNKLRHEENDWIKSFRTSTNESDFTGLLGGFRHSIKNHEGVWLFSGMQKGGVFWSATEKDSGEAFTWTIGSNTDEVGQSSSEKKWGFSVRCMRDIYS